VAECAERSGNVAVGSGAQNLESVGRGDQGLAFEDAAEGLDFGWRPGGEVGQSALDDAGAEAGGLAEEDGGRGIAVGDGLDIHGFIISQYITHHNIYFNYYMGTNRIQN
jgi:hypothetical protein